MASDEFSSFQVYKNLHLPTLITGGVFALIALVLSLMLIFRHLRSYTNPSEQKWIIAVLFMVPVYATESIISLCDSRFSMTCDILRNCYEAFALYAFGRYLVACLGGEPRVVEMLENKANQELREELLEKGGEEGENKKGSFCDFFCHPAILGKDMYTTVKFGLVQYMILKTTCAFLALILEILGVYGDGEFKWYYGYPYIAFVINFSQSWALYCLVQFYHVTHETLQPIRPLEKFISFKAIVFATWWQGVAIAIMCYFGIFPKTGKIQNAIQNFLICIEVNLSF
ncbi:transmembrane protein 184 [Carex littledalei]|uniref:Transmembrane protein 184 n=1 Tax=Carex littledalei TaxID=544730 RepID=A0A833QJS4_9POAL|nr:transmembrane protein 184 [Carex littledalei]